MTTQSIRPEALSKSDWHQIFARSAEEQEEPTNEHGSDNFDSVAVNDVDAETPRFRT